MPQRVVFAVLIYASWICGVHGAPAAAESKDPGPWLVEQLRAPENGTVETIHIQIGDYVEERQVLISLDHFRQNHLLKVATIRAEDKSRVNSASAEVGIRKATLDDLRERARRRLANDLQLRQAEATLADASAKLDAANAAQSLSQLDLELAQYNYDSRFIKSPIAGVVVSIQANRGEPVRAGSVVATVAESASWKRTVSVPEEVLSRLRVGMFLPVTLADGRRQLAQVVDLIPGEGKEVLAELVVANSNSRELTKTENAQFEFSELSPTYAKPWGTYESDFPTSDLQGME